MLNFAVFIFGMRHPVELRGLLDNLEAVMRAKAGAEDGALDAEESMSNEDKFAKLKAAITAGNEGAMSMFATAAISLISIFHVDQLPALMPIFMTLKTPEGPSIFKPGAGSFMDKAESLEGHMVPSDVIRTVAIWAVACFSKFHPDVVIKMGLVDQASHMD